MKDEHLNSIKDLPRLEETVKETQEKAEAESPSVRKIAGECEGGICGLIWKPKPIAAA